MDINISENLSKKDIVELLLNNDINKDLFLYADKVRNNSVGTDIHLRALIEFSNICKQNCFYCGLRAKNSIIQRYKVGIDTIVKCAKKAYDIGYRTVVLQSGESEIYTDSELVSLIQQLKKINLAVTLSIGEKTYEQYKLYKQAGANRYLLRIETTDKQLYTKMHPNMNFENRKKCLEYLKDLKYEVGTGCLVGLPNQTIESLADDILFFKNLEADMIGIGPFIACPNTPLEKVDNGSLDLSLKVMAITRILLPTINIPATTAMETIKPNGQTQALCSGANVLMINVLDNSYIQKYKIYPKNDNISENIVENRNIVIEKIKKLNRTISVDYGISKHFLEE